MHVKTFIQKKQNVIFFLFLIFSLVSCGGSGDGGANDNSNLDVEENMDGSDESSALVLTMSFHQVKAFQFEWNSISNVDHYVLSENSDGISGFSVLDSKVLATDSSYEHIVPLFKRINAQYLLQACFSTDESDCISSNIVSSSGMLANSSGYFKASDPSSTDEFGNSVSLSGDGDTLAVGAHLESSNATGVNGSQINYDSMKSGAVYVFTREGSFWQQHSYLKASNTDAGDLFGQAVSLNYDGTLLAISAAHEQSISTGINGNQADNTSDESGAVYVFSLVNSTWQQQAYIKASNTDAFDVFGISVNLNDNGDTLAVGALFEDSNAKDVNNNQLDNTAIDSGAVYIFTRVGTSWSQQAYIKASNTGGSDFFGWGVSLSGNGDALVVNAPNEDSSSTIIDGNQADNTAEDAGAVYVFTRTGSTWVQQTYIKASNTDAGDLFGRSVIFSSDGSTIAIGSIFEQSNTIGVNGNQINNSLRSGAVYIFSAVNNSWEQQAYIKASNTGGGDRFGHTVALSSDGNTLAVGALFEESNDTGINANQADNSLTQSGAVYTFFRAGTSWIQQSYIKASNAESYHYYSESISLSGDGNTLIVGAILEDNAAAGINGNQNSPNAPILDSGAVYVY